MKFVNVYGLTGFLKNWNFLKKLLYWDNKVVIVIAHNSHLHDRTKHIDVDKHFIKEKTDMGVTCLSYLPTIEHTIDMLTKGFPKKKYFINLSTSWLWKISTNSLRGSVGFQCWLSIMFIFFIYICNIYFLIGWRCFFYIRVPCIRFRCLRRNTIILFFSKFNCFLCKSMATCSVFYDCIGACSFFFMKVLVTPFDVLLLSYSCKSLSSREMPKDQKFVS